MILFVLCDRFSCVCLTNNVHNIRVLVKRIVFVLQCCGLEMDKENGKANESSSSSSKVANVQDQAALLDAASLFGGEFSHFSGPVYSIDFVYLAYWPRSDASAANLFAAASGFGLPTHAAASALPFGMLPPSAAAQTSRSGSGSTSSASGLPPNYPAVSSTSASSAAAAAAAYSNAAYSNTLSVAASQAASLGMPAASK